MGIRYSKNNFINIFLLNTPDRLTNLVIHYIQLHHQSIPVKKSQALPEWCWPTINTGHGSEIKTITVKRQ